MTIRFENHHFHRHWGQLDDTAAKLSISMGGPQILGSNHAEAGFEAVHQVADRLPLPASLGGVSVTVNGVAAPVYAVASADGREQVNFQAPFEIEGRASASVVVTRAGLASAAVEVPVLDLQPAIYAVDGAEAIVVRSQDYTLVTRERPLAPGEFAFFYASGLGRVANRPDSGAGAPLSPLAAVLADVRVTLAGLPCEAQFAGLARVPARPELTLAFLPTPPAACAMFP